MLGHTDIQTTLIYLHERDCIVTTAEPHISNCSLPPSPRRWPRVHARGLLAEARAPVLHHTVRPGRHATA